MAITPSKVSVDQIRVKLMRPALTSNYYCEFKIPEKVTEQLGFNGIYLNDDLLNISCSEANLPGSSLATHDLNNDFTGVTQKHAYRRLYDDRSDFTFYVNNTYSQIRVFEIWMRYISGEQLTFGSQKNVHYRMNYPKNYKADELIITKFERDLATSVKYTFVNAFPLAVSSMPISYDSSQLLKCTVSFSYDRYFMDNPRDIQPGGEPGQQTAAGVPDLPGLSGTGALGNGTGSPLNIAPSQYNISPGTITNNFVDGEEIINAINANQRQIESGLPYVGRNIGPLAP